VHHEAIVTVATVRPTPFNVTFSGRLRASLRSKVNSVDWLHDAGERGHE
jgi:hypothetical protein